MRSGWTSAVNQCSSSFCLDSLKSLPVSRLSASFILLTIRNLPKHGFSHVALRFLQPLCPEEAHFSSWGQGLSLIWLQPTLPTSCPGQLIRQPHPGWPYQPRSLFSSCFPTLACHFSQSLLVQTPLPYPARSSRVQPRHRLLREAWGSAGFLTPTSPQAPKPACTPECLSLRGPLG